MSSLETAAILQGGCSNDSQPSSSHRLNLKRKHSELNEEEVASKVIHLESTGPNFVDDIPDEVIWTIFQNLKGNDLFNLSRTCIRLQNLVNEASLWQDVDLTDKPLSLTDAKKRLVYLNDKTESIKIKGMVSTYPRGLWDKVTVSKMMMKQIQKNSPNLKSFELQEGFINLQKMGIGDFPKSIENLKLHNVKLKNLAEISSIFVNMDHHFENLSCLKIEYCSFIRPYDLMVISKFPNLKKLSVKGSSSFQHMVPYCSVAARLGFKTLEYLDLSETPINDSDLQCFNAVKTLTTLIVGCVDKPRDALIEAEEKKTEARRSLGGNNELQREVIVVQLRLRAGNPDPVVQRLPPSPEVCSRFYHTILNDTQDADKKISDRSICSFGVSAERPAGFIRIVNDALRLNTVNNLQKLVINNYKKVSDSSLDHLSQCAPFLSYLDVRGTGVTPAGVEKFKLRKPRCTVVF